MNFLLYKKILLFVNNDVILEKTNFKEKIMVSKIDRSFDDKFAAAWYGIGGTFSYKFSKKLLAYLSNNNIKAKNVLDVYCGAGNFLDVMQDAGFSCVGTEGSAAFIRFNQKNYPDMKFYHSENMANFGTKEKFDLITCIYDLVNYLEIYSDWVELFTAAYKQLNKGGSFVFDFNTLKRLSDWNYTYYEQAKDVDYVESVKSGVFGKTVIDYVYYVRDGEWYDKTSTKYTQTSFEVETVVKSLKKIGFKEVKVCNFDLAEIVNPETENKVHIIATK